MKTISNLQSVGPGFNFWHHHSLTLWLSTLLVSVRQFSRIKEDQIVVSITLNNILGAGSTIKYIAGILFLITVGFVICLCVCLIAQTKKLHRAGMTHPKAP